MLQSKKSIFLPFKIREILLLKSTFSELEVYVITTCIPYQ